MTSPRALAALLYLLLALAWGVVFCCTHNPLTLLLVAGPLGLAAAHLRTARA